jgi:membrane protein
MTHRARTPQAVPATRLGRLRAWSMGWWPLLKQTLADWLEDKAPRLGAALAFYTVLSLAPLLVIVTPILGAVIGSDEARRGVAAQFEALVGPEGAAAVEVMLEDPQVSSKLADSAEEVAATKPATRPTTLPLPRAQSSDATTPVTTAPTTLPARRGPVWPSRLAWALSIGVLIFGATNVFAELQDSLNTIWEVTPRPGASFVWGFVRQRLLSFAMVMSICFLLLVSLVLSAVFEAVRAYFASTWIERSAQFWQLANNGASFLVVTLLFALMFKVLPDVKLRWRDVMIGALLTAGLFTVGRHVIGQYLGRVGVGERYGASRSLVALLVWVYYSAQILLLGAEFTKVWSRRAGGRVQPTEVAVPITEEARAQAGIAHKEVVEAVKDVVERKEADGCLEPGKEIHLEDEQRSM